MGVLFNVSLKVGCEVSPHSTKHVAVLVPTSNYIQFPYQNSVLMWTQFCRFIDVRFLGLPGDPSASLHSTHKFLLAAHNIVVNQLSHNCPQNLTVFRYQFAR